MGIAGFFIWLQRNYRAAIDPIGPDVITAAEGHKFMQEKKRARQQQEADERAKREEGGEDDDAAGMLPQQSSGAESNSNNYNNNNNGGYNNNNARYDGPPRRFNAVPTFDSLYLDMNGLIHPCCHHTAPLPEPECEEEMFVRIFKQLDSLMEIAKPRKILFLAVDGVAPRSKMNQQRARRFRAATERQEANEIAQEMADAVKKLHHLPVPETKERWDHNVITPSTPFMERVGQILEWYVLKRLNSDDPLWKNLTVILSDAHVPGEGEHKIMHYIRALRSEETYDPATTHLIYGMDADLIVLGAVTHELNFFILRNRLDQDTKQATPDKFCVFSVRKFRELLGKDFENLTGYMDFERVIDDFVFLCFFIGNDFLPHMPLVEIKQRGIETMLDHYVNIFFDRFKQQDYDNCRVDNNNNNNNNRRNHNRRQRNNNNHDDESPIRYLTEKGEILFDNLRYFLESFVHSKYSELLELHSEKGRQVERAKMNVDSRIEALNRDIQGHLAQLKPDRSNGEEVGAAVFKCYVETATEQRRFVGGQFTAPFEYGGPDYRVKYYTSKFGWKAPRTRSDYDGLLNTNNTNNAQTNNIPNLTDEEEEFEKLIATCCREYLRGMQWVMRYYTVGVPSWSWFYPYHFAPLFEDVARYCYNVNIDMRLDAPLHPVHQLLAVLPQESYQALPPELHDHVLKKESALTKFYPTSIEVDFTEATFNYQGVIKLPFISVDKLKKTADKVFKAEPDFGCSLVFTRSETSLSKSLHKLVKYANESAARKKKKHHHHDSNNKNDDDDDENNNNNNNDDTTTATTLAEPSSGGGQEEAHHHNAMPLVPPNVIRSVPISGRIGKYEYEWPVNSEIDCPDRGFETYNEKEGAPIKKNRVHVYKYEMRMHTPYLPQLLVQKNTSASDYRKGERMTGHRRERGEQ